MSRTAALQRNGKSVTGIGVPDEALVGLSTASRVVVLWMRNFCGERDTGQYAERDASARRSLRISVQSSTPNTRLARYAHRDRADSIVGARRLAFPRLPQSCPARYRPSLVFSLSDRRTRYWLAWSLPRQRREWFSRVRIGNARHGRHAQPWCIPGAACWCLAVHSPTHCGSGSRAPVWPCAPRGPGSRCRCSTSISIRVLPLRHRWSVGSMGRCCSLR